MVERANGGEPIPPSTDRSLIDRARDGDLDAFEEIVRANMDAVYRRSYAILGDEDDARDAAQQTFIDAWRGLRGLRDSAKFEAWLQRTSVNAARMTMRARSRRRVREIPTDRVAALAEHVAPSDADRLGDAFARLAIDQRAILTLHYLEGHSVAELAVILEIPDGTVKSRLHTARRALQAALDAEGSDR